LAGLTVLAVVCWAPRIALAHGDLELRIAAVTERLATNATASLWLERADLRRQHREFIPALADLAEAGRQEPNWFPIPLQRARIYFDAGQFNSAIRAADDCLTLETNCPDALILRARSHAALSQWAEAVADADLVVAGPAAPLPDVYLERARWQASLRKFAAAADGLDAAQRRIGITPSLMLPAVEYSLEAGDSQAAAERLARVQRYLPVATVMLWRSNILAADLKSPTNSVATTASKP
jgi:tetratricopeptide (TPR) repeat protein